MTSQNSKNIQDHQEKTEKANSKHKWLWIEYFIGNFLVDDQKCYFIVITSVICVSNVQIFLDFNHIAYPKCVHCNVKYKDYWKVYKRTSIILLKWKKWCNSCFWRSTDMTLNEGQQNLSWFYTITIIHLPELIISTLCLVLFV